MNLPHFSKPGDLFVSPDGDDRWTGYSSEPDGRGVHGPKRTILAARDQLRLLHNRGAMRGGETVWLAGGTYPVRKPLEFDYRDPANVTYSAIPGQTPVLDGGERIRGFEEISVNGVSCWVADVALLVERHGPWKSLFVDGVRATCSRYPREGWLWMESVPGIDLEAGLFDGTNSFVAKPGDLDNIPDLLDAEVVVAHFWIEERMPVASYDPSTRLLTSSRTAVFALKDSYNPNYAKYFIENTKSGLVHPGSWFLDIVEKRLYYVPLPGQKPESTEVVVPLVLQLARFLGTEEKPVCGITLRGLTLKHTDWAQPVGYGLWWDPYLPASEWGVRDSFSHIYECSPDPRKNYANAPQAASHVPGAIHYRYARHCALEDCTLEHLGMYGVSYFEGCQRDRVEGCTIRDTGAGGINIDGGGNEAAPTRLTGRISITDNRISNTGHVWISAVGILSAHSARNRILHNEIFDCTYSAISVGWVWGYNDNPSHSIIVAKNRIHHVAERGGMADLGGIYTLGPQPGTILKGNVISEIADSAYGGWGIYLDEGSAFITVEDNLVYRCSSNCLHEHIGRQNVFRNNVFAFGGKIKEGKAKGGVLTLCDQPHWNWLEYPPLLTTIERNILLTNGTPIYEDSMQYMDQPSLLSDLNLVWDLAGQSPVMWVHKPHPAVIHPGQAPETRLSFAEFQKLGYDCHSAVADPGFADPMAGDFQLAPDSPALALGFVPPDWSDVGPRPRNLRQSAV